MSIVHWDTEDTHRTQISAGMMFSTPLRDRYRVGVLVDRVGDNIAHRDRPGEFQCRLPVFVKKLPLASTVRANSRSPRQPGSPPSRWRMKNQEPLMRKVPRVGFEPTTLRSLARLFRVDQPDALPSLWTQNRLSYRGTERAPIQRGIKSFSERGSSYCPLNCKLLRCMSEKRVRSLRSKVNRYRVRPAH